MHPSRPALSVVVVIYDMEREARRSLYSLSAAYQQGIGPDEYEVIVVDNGSRQPFHDASVAEFGPNFKYYYVHDANRSPARALNIGVSLARSNYLAIMIDGARILTPRVLRYGLMLPKLYERPCGLTHGFHIGPDFQSRSIQQGYNREAEDLLFEQIAWPEDGYRLFDVSSAHDPTDGWFRIVGESNCTFLHRDLLEEAGGFDERYVSMGGGLINPALQAALYEIAGVEFVIILGEGTFHQYHGGATSGTPWTQIPDMLDDFNREFREIYGKEYKVAVEPKPRYVGHMPEQAMRFLPKFAAAVELVEQENKVRWLHAEVAQRDKTVEWLHAEVAARDRLVEALRNEILLRERQLELIRAEASQRTRIAASHKGPIAREGTP
ncbi:MAG: glycosyltransferase [Burkholderiales bacterium]